MICRKSPILKKLYLHAPVNSNHEQLFVETVNRIREMGKAKMKIYKGQDKQTKKHVSSNFTQNELQFH